MPLKCPKLALTPIRTLETVSIFAWINDSHGEAQFLRASTCDDPPATVALARTGPAFATGSATGNVAKYTAEGTKVAQWNVSVCNLVVWLLLSDASEQSASVTHVVWGHTTDRVFACDAVGVIRICNIDGTVEQGVDCGAPIVQVRRNKLVDPRLSDSLQISCVAFRGHDVLYASTTERCLRVVVGKPGRKHKFRQVRVHGSLP